MLLAKSEMLTHSPYQLLLVFFGRFETERPVDWVADKLKVAMKDDITSEPQKREKAISALILAASGVATASVICRYVGDAWALSTAIGTSIFSFLYEIARPRRLDADQAAAQHEAWIDFETFADGGLVKAGSCHESEIIEAFVAKYPKYRSLIGEEITEKQIRRFVLRWNRFAERTPYGFYKNVALSNTFKEGMKRAL